MNEETVRKWIFKMENASFEFDESLKRLIERIKSILNVLAVFVFGSSVKGNAKPISDVDIAVILEDPDPDVEAEIGSLYSEKIDLVLFHRMPLHIQFEVLKHGIPIFCRDDEKLFEIKFKVLRDYLEHSWIYRRMSEEVIV